MIDFLALMVLMTPVVMGCLITIYAVKAVVKMVVNAYLRLFGKCEPLHVIENGDL